MNIGQRHKLAHSLQKAMYRLSWPKIKEEPNYVAQMVKELPDEIKKAWLKPLGYSDTINEAAINFILREFVMSKVSYESMMNMDMVVNILRPQLEHQTSYFSHQPSLRLYHHRDMIGSREAFTKVSI